MSRPEDIPEWAWDEAEDVYNWVIPFFLTRTISESKKQSGVARFARALLAAEQRGAEREREAIAAFMPNIADIVADKVIAPSPLREQIREAVIAAAGIFANAIRGRKA